MVWWKLGPERHGEDGHIVDRRSLVDQRSGQGIAEAVAVRVASRHVLRRLTETFEAFVE
jgi:hypothetical protein